MIEKSHFGMTVTLETQRFADALSEKSDACGNHNQERRMG
jgi:hypothetical protein